ncbi:MAG: hydrolase Nlp/P60, partial [Acidimicrobiia bacterium]
MEPLVGVMRVVGAGMAVSAALPVGAAAVVAAGVGSAAPSAEALADIPAPLLAAYERPAATCPGL